VHRDLLFQAKTLATLDTKRPKQANLRRAVSAAYYAVFHYLVEQACRVLMGTQHEQRAYRQVLARAFSHGTMKAACTSLAGGTMKSAVAKGLPAHFVVPREIRALARTLTDAQDWRHEADYDLTVPFFRADVLTMIQQVETDIQGFNNLPPSNEKSFFLACLLAWKELANR
jgi:uncharacterized protein (UPF0332 family)